MSCPTLFARPGSGRTAMFATTHSLLAAHSRTSSDHLAWSSKGASGRFVLSFGSVEGLLMRSLVDHGDTVAKDELASGPAREAQNRKRAA